MKNKEQEKPKRQIVIVKSIIINKDDEFLFVRRKRDWHKEAHNKWEFAGGKIEFGEEPNKTAVREAKEETGFDVEVDFLLPIVLSAHWEYDDRLSQQILLCYVCNLKGGKPNIEDHGVSELKWFNSTNIPKKEDCLPGTIEFLKEYLALKKKK